MINDLVASVKRVLEYVQSTMFGIAKCLRLTHMPVIASYIWAYGVSLPTQPLPSRAIVVVVVLSPRVYKEMSSGESPIPRVSVYFIPL